MPKRIDLSFTGKGGNADPERLAEVGPSIRVRVSYDASRKDAKNSSVEDAGALLDTGADYSHIDYRLARRLSLPIADRGTIHTAEGPAEVDLYLAQIYVPDFDFIQRGEFLSADLSAGFGGNSVLLGRSFLTKFKLTYDGRSGRVTLER